MEDSPSSLQVDNTADMPLRRWTKSLPFLPEFVFEILKKCLGTEMSASNNLKERLKKSTLKMFK